jgi:hypothetical protein
MIDVCRKDFTTLLPHELNRSRKLLAETTETELPGFVDSDDSQGHHRHSMRELLLQPRDIWMEDRQEPRQPKGLKQRILDPIYEKKKSTKLG